MNEVFEALAVANNRKIIEVLTAHPASTESEIGTFAKFTNQQTQSALKHLRKAGLITARGTGTATKFSVSTAVLGKAAGWLNNFVPAEKNKLEQKIEEQVENLADKVGEWLANGSSWVQTKLAENTDFKTPEDLGREIGRRLADAKKQADDTVGDNVREVIAEVKKRVRR